MPPAQIPETHRQRQCNQNQKYLSRATPGRVFVIEQIVEISRWRPVMRIALQPKATPRARRSGRTQSQKRRTGNTAPLARNGRGTCLRRSRCRGHRRRNIAHTARRLITPRPSLGCRQQGCPASAAKTICRRIVVSTTRTAHTTSLAIAYDILQFRCSIYRRKTRRDDETANTST